MKHSKQASKYELPIKLSIFCALVAAGVAAASLTVSAQTASPSASSAGVLSNSTPSAAAKQGVPKSATPDMINEAIQRSQARAAREAQTGQPQQWGSEEPFTYNPAQKNFTAAQQ